MGRSQRERAAGDRAHHHRLRSLRAQGLVLTESWGVRRGMARLRPRFDDARRVYELCDGWRRQARRRAGRLSRPMADEPGRTDDGTSAIHEERPPGPGDRRAQVDESLAAEDLVATAWQFRGVGAPDFVAAPVGAAGEEAGQPVIRLDDDRAAALWGHLRGGRSRRPPRRVR